MVGGRTAEQRGQQAGHDQGHGGDHRHRHSGHRGMTAAGLHRLLEDRIDKQTGTAIQKARG